MKSFKSISLAITMLTSFLIFGQEKDTIITKVQGLQIAASNKTTPYVIKLNCGNYTKKPKKNKAFIVIDNQKSTTKKLSKLKSEEIESVNIVKSDKAIALYGKKAKNGAIIITTKKLTVKN